MKINFSSWNILFLLILWLYEDTLSAYPSLFFTDEEIACRRKSQEGASSPDNMTLHAILFHTEQQWSVWLGGQVISSENMKELKNFRIENITPTEVTISNMKKEGETQKSIILSVY